MTTMTRRERVEVRARQRETNARERTLPCGSQTTTESENETECQKLNGGAKQTVNSVRHFSAASACVCIAGVRLHWCA